MDVVPIAADLDRALRAAGTPARAVSEKRYLKSDLVHYGAGAPAIRQAVRALGPVTRDHLIALAAELWREPARLRLKPSRCEGARQVVRRSLASKGRRSKVEGSGSGSGTLRPSTFDLRRRACAAPKRDLFVHVWSAQARLVLRETGKKRPELVAAWLLPRAHRASGLTFREASRNLPPPLRTRLEKARDAG